MNTLKKTSLDWTLNHLLYESDTDLFPKPFEIDIIKNNWINISTILQKTDITNYSWQGVRRLLIPKDEFSFRNICQLDPIDSILFSAIIKEIGAKIEKCRIPVSAEQIFSYRFAPTKKGHFYGGINLWENFWTVSKNHTQFSNFIVITDITDFYNQIYHHTVENQLDYCKVKKPYITAIMNMLKNTTQGVSRGIPVGSHGSHILAELALIPVDEFLRLKGYKFCRYVDDIHVFCDTREAAQIAIYELADILDKTQKLLLNREKTKILDQADFWTKAESMLINNPINDQEEIMINAIKSEVKSPYVKINLSQLSAEDLEKLSKENIENVLDSYINQRTPNYVRLRWLLRRLSQTGVPGGVEFIINNISKFMPAIADAANYLKSAQPNYRGNWQNIGNQLIQALESSLVMKNEYLQVVILSLFSRINDLNHIEHLIQTYDKYGAIAQRKIILAATTANASAWLRLFKSQYSNLDPWLKRAVLYSFKTLPKDERNFWFKNIKRSSTELEKAIVEMIKN